MHLRLGFIGTARPRREPAEREPTGREPPAEAAPSRRVGAIAIGPHLTGSELAKFTVLVAGLAIFFDASLGHGATWENDPYWTYWITKTFLIATIFGLGTAWLGIGEGRGALITAVHTIVLTVYYWTFSPIGLPASPTWLDLEHTWISGLPIHFGVIYLGYLAALWLWRHRQRLAAIVPTAYAAPIGLAALVAGVVIVIAAGGLSSLALGEFPGVTWFLVRLLMTIPFLLVWWSLAGRDPTAAIAGGVMLALMWATYSQFVGPTGLPNRTFRFFDTAAPPANVEWLGYRDIWLIGLSIHAAVIVLVMLIYSDRTALGRAMWRPLTAVVAFTALPLLIGVATPVKDRGETATLTASGPVMVEVGNLYSGDFQSGTADVNVVATNMSNRVSPLPPHDQLMVDATVNAGGRTYQLTVRRPMVTDPLGRHGTWYGVGFDVEHYGTSGIGTSALPNIKSKLDAYGLGELTVDGQPVATGVPVHVTTADSLPPNGSRLELTIGDPEILSLPNLPSGIRALWPSYVGDFPAERAEWIRYLGGGLLLFTFIIVALALNWGERTIQPRRVPAS